MTQLSFSKKQISPIIAKYSIDAENDPIFASIIKLCNDQTNYQVWALKCVYGELVKLRDIEIIINWAKENRFLIPFLALKNIVAYKNAELIGELFHEMEGANKYNLVKSTFLMFNTEQRNLLIDSVIAPIANASEAYKSKDLATWFTICAKIKNLSVRKRQNLINTASAIHQMDNTDDHIGLLSHLSSVLKERYSWNKAELLAYRLINTPNSKVVYDNSNIVIINVVSFQDSKSLCGSGRTGWCLTREASYFRQYVTDRGSKQYFWFDFSLREDDELAHIGFTIDKTGNITNAHSTSNSNMLGDGIYYSKTRVNITRVLDEHHVPMDTFINLYDLTHFSWDVESFLSYVSKQKTFEVVYSKNNIVAIKSAYGNYNLGKLIDFSLVSPKAFMSNTSKLLLLFDFNKPVQDTNSCLFIAYRKDEYECESAYSACNAYSATMPESSINDILRRKGIKRSEIETTSTINPDLALHKYINEANISKALELLSETESINVNRSFKNSIPVFKAIGMTEVALYEAIINHPSFNSNELNQFNGTCLHSLLMSYGIETDETSKKHNEKIVKMIEASFKSNKFDINARDLNYDTILHIAVSQPCLHWLAAKLIKDFRVNINLINDIMETPFTRALRMKSMELIQLFGTRPDLVVSDEDTEIARKQGIDLGSVIKPQTITNEEREILTSTNSNNDANNAIDEHCLSKELADIFADAFGY